MDTTHPHQPNFLTSSFKLPSSQITVTPSSHCDEWHRKDGVHQVNSCSVFCFSLSSAWPTDPTLSKPFFLRGRFVPFLMVPSVSLITAMWLLIDLFSQTHLWGRWWLCLHLAWLWLLHSPGVSPVLSMFCLSYQTFFVLVASVVLSEEIEGMVPVSPGFLILPCLRPRLPGEGGSHLSGREYKQQHKYGSSWWKHLRTRSLARWAKERGTDYDWSKATDSVPCSATETEPRTRR